MEMKPRFFWGGISVLSRRRRRRRDNIEIPPKTRKDKQTTLTKRTNSH
jgi:hypothetical protein